MFDDLDQLLRESREWIFEVADDLIDPSLNAPRDRWLYHHRLKGMGWDKLRNALQDIAPRTGWESIASREGVIAAVKRFCRAQGLEFPARKPGRPAKKQ